jgi:hypothetical protein
VSWHFQKKKLTVVGRHTCDNDPMTRVLLFHQLHRDARCHSRNNLLTAHVINKK